MTAAVMVNLILEKFRTGNVVFFQIDEEDIEVVIGGRLYILLLCDSGVKDVFHVLDEGIAIDNYSQWVMGVLQGKTRDENGVLS